MLSPVQSHLLADRFRGLDYTVDAVVSAIGESAHRALGRNQTAPATRALADRDDALVTPDPAVAAAAAGAAVGALDEALPGLGCRLVRAGILERSSTTGSVRWWTSGPTPADDGARTGSSARI